MMKNSGLLFLAIGLLSISMLGFAFLPYLSSLAGSSDISGAYSSLGEQIYFTGRGDNGRPIPYDRGPRWLRLMGGGCSSCHGDDGQGGFQIMMSAKESPSIAWEALTEEGDNKHGEEKHAPYDKRTIKRAITKSLNPAGQELDSVMPRWELNQAELDAVIDFLKKLD